MSDFKVGDRVLCIDDSEHTSNGIQSTLKKGREYIVYGLGICKCGILLDIGITCIVKAINIKCGWCKDTRPDDGIHYAHSRRFVKVKPEYQVVKSEIKEKEPEVLIAELN